MSNTPSRKRLAKEKTEISLIREDQHDEAQKSPKRPRRTQEERTREARDRLLKAATEVLIEKGYNRLTTKEVASRAGLSNGALMHHFSSKAELIIAATAALYDVMIEKGQRVVRSPKALKDPIEGFVTDCLSVYFEWPFFAAIEVLVVARTDPELMLRIRPILQNYVDTTAELWLDVFRKTGMSANEARAVLNLTLNLARGLGVNRLWANPETDYQQIVKDCTKLIKERLLRK